MKKAYFKNIVGIGDLYHVKSYYKYDCYDCVFTCEDAQNQLYFCILTSVGPKVEEYSVFRTTPQLLNEYANRRVSLLYMAKMGNGWVYDITEDESGVDHSIQTTIEGSMLANCFVAMCLLP